MLLKELIDSLSTHTCNELIRIVSRHVVLLRHLSVKIEVIVLRKKIELLIS